METNNQNVRYFADYQWRNKSPEGINEMPAPPQNGKYYKFISASHGVRVEQYDEAGKFLQLCFDPQDSIYKGKKSPVFVNGIKTMSYYIDEQDGITKYEKYEPLNDGPDPMVRCEVFSSDYRLIEVHNPVKISDTRQELHVYDAMGKLKLIIHCESDDGGPMQNVREEWM